MHSYFQQPRYRFCDAGDLLPTSGADVLIAADTENSNWEVLNSLILDAVAHQRLDAATAQAWNIKLLAWKAYYQLLLTVPPPTFSWESMAQLDQWRTERASWAKLLASRGETVPGAMQSSDRPGPADSVKGVANVNSIAQILLVGGFALGALYLFKR